MESDNVNFDNEVLAFLSKRKNELIEEHGRYIAEKPEIREVLNDFLSAVLLSKPVSLIFHLSFLPCFVFRTMSMCMQKSTFIRSIQHR